MIKGVTFDLWDTMVRDDSDEPRRAAAGLRSKKAERRHLLWSALNQASPIEMDRVELAYAVADAAFDRVWHEQFVTWTIAERLRVLLTGLGRSLPEEEFRRLVRAHETMEVDLPPDPVDGIEEALAALSGRYKLCVISDTIVTPGHGLRALLDRHGLARYFGGFVFSDEVGRSKPHRAMFEAAGERLGLALSELAHVGDRGHNDVEGARAAGMKAILFTAVRREDHTATSADAICTGHRDLPGIIDRMG